MDIKIFIAAHKSFQMPASDLYVPLHVGAAGKPDLGYLRDDTGDNISEKNPYYCECTGLYWVWKNVKADYYGLMHYRRWFVRPGAIFPKRDSDRKLPDQKCLERLFERTDIILPKKRNYVIESVYSHYAHTHYKEHLDIARDIVEKQCPDYLEAYDRVMGSRTAHMFNMMIMKADRFKAYCAWLFSILRELEARVDTTGYDAFQLRYPGRVAEILLNVWIEKNRYSYVEIPVVMLGKVRMMRKVISFLRAKFAGKRYRQGF